MKYSINKTEIYHQEQLHTLGWELTVCNAMDNPRSPVRSILKHNASFGIQLFLFLKKLVPGKTWRNILEIGGGYGFLMRDFIDCDVNINATMVDISKQLLDVQKKELMNHEVNFILADVFTLDDKFFNKFDLVILNENMGDFPTIVKISTDKMKNYENDYIQRMVYLTKQYNLHYPDYTTVNFNVGACDIIEKLCISGIKYIYAGEHSCEVKEFDPFTGKSDINLDGIPEKIQLCGHDEYTIKFSFLSKIAEEKGYYVHRGRFADFIEIDITEEINYILKSMSSKDEHEIIRQFIGDLYKYEYLFLIKEE